MFDFLSKYFKRQRQQETGERVFFRLLQMNEKLQSRKSVDLLG